MRSPTLPVTVLVVAATSAQTPQPTPTPPAFAEVIQVTATRIPEDVDKVPASIQVITADELRERGATDLKSALALAAGVDIAPGGDNGPASSVPEFWGLKEFDAFLLVVDGVPWGGAFNPALGTLDLRDVERIEVQRGPASVMYGATSFVGVIQVVRRAPGGKGGRVAVTGGSYESGGAALSAGIPTWLGFDSSVSGDFERQGFEDDRTSFKKGHLLWRNRRSWGQSAFHFDLDGTWLRQEPASPTPRQGRVLSPLVPIDANHNPQGAFLDENRYFANVGYDRGLALGTWSTTLSYTHSSQGQFRGFLADVSNDVPNAAGFRAKIGQNDLYFDSHLAWTKASTWKAVAGVDYLFGKAEAEGDTFDYGVNLDGSGAPSSIPLGEDRAIRDTRNTEFDGEPTQLAGKRLEMSPHNLGALALSWAPENGLFGSAEMSYVGSRFLNKRNTALAEHYATLAAHLGYRHGRLELRVSGRNLTDRRDPVAESELGDAQYYRLFPRRFDAVAALRF